LIYRLFCFYQVTLNNNKPFLK